MCKYKLWVCLCLKNEKKWKILVKRKPKETKTNGIYFPFDQISGVCVCHWKQTENKSCMFVPVNGNKRNVVLICPNKHQCLQFYNNNRTNETT